ncbi:MAG: hypothetical protein K0R92_3608 [Lachnospiraceae bacterium]|jgi:hypothetical protein|nr:hypothetical protein [Lachnospiraceae bacterium]
MKKALNENEKSGSEPFLLCSHLLEMWYNLYGGCLNN